jgi:hypothetical protein
MQYLEISHQMPPIPEEIVPTRSHGGAGDQNRNQLVTAIVSNSSTSNWGPVMDENEDSKTPSARPEVAGDPTGPAAPPPAGLDAEPAGAPKGELAHVASPAIAPVTVDVSAEAPARAAHEAAERFEQTQRRPHAAAPASRDVIPLAPRAAGSASRRFSKFTLLAASLVLASALGAMAGVLGATGVARLAPLFGGETASASEPSGPETTIAQLRSDIAALKASVDTTSRTTGAQYNKLVERLDRAERVQSVATKADAAYPKETTGSITPPSATATPAPVAPVPSPAASPGTIAPGTIAPGTTVPGWAVRDVYRGVAMLQSRMGGMVEVETGDVLPGLGRIESIRRQDGRWVVFTSKGMITSMR